CQYLTVLPPFLPLRQPTLFPCVPLSLPLSPLSRPPPSPSLSPRLCLEGCVCLQSAHRGMGPRHLESFSEYVECVCVCVKDERVCVVMNWISFPTYSTDSR